jgi:hypothetical protein
METTEQEPNIVQKRAIDVTPCFHGVWCTVAGGKPFVNVIEGRNWSDDGSKIVWILGSFNFDLNGPDDIVNVVEVVPWGTYHTREKEAVEHAEFCKRRVDNATLARMMAQ